MKRYKVADDFIGPVKGPWEYEAEFKRALKEILRTRDGGSCRWCGRQLTFDHYIFPLGIKAYATIDHLIMQANGGSDDPANLVLSCVKCNARRHKSTWKPKRQDALALHESYTLSNSKLVKSRWIEKKLLESEKIIDSSV